MDYVFTVNGKEVGGDFLDYIKVVSILNVTLLSVLGVRNVSASDHLGDCEQSANPRDGGRARNLHRPKL